MWYTKQLGDAIFSQDVLEEITEHVLSKAHGEFALYSKVEATGAMHCQQILFFSPALKVIALKLGATPCALPDPNGLRLLAGEDILSGL